MFSRFSQLSVQAALETVWLQLQDLQIQIDVGN